jgi:L-seryl-tRNA(Ser) seleniumtransferase
MPSQQIPTWCIALRPAHGSLDDLAAALRTGTPSVIGRIQQDRLLLDLRSVFPRQDMELVEAVQSLNSGPASPAAEQQSIEIVPQ